MTRAVAAAFFLLLIVPAAAAQTCEMCGVENPDPGGSWGWDDPTMEQATYRNPSPTSCYAVSSGNQRCRECAPAYDREGMYKGYDVCAYVPRNASCSCKNAASPSCAGEGSCTYFVM